jgi:HKD family nuclease
MAKDTQPKNVEIVLNEPPDNHLSVLKSLLRSAERFQCMTAFAKQAGLKLIHKELKERLGAGLSARFVVGLNFYQTDPLVLEELLKFSERYALELLVSRPPWANHALEEVDTPDSTIWNFHTKVFAFESAWGSSVLIGSANMTRGGLLDNHEASILVRDGSEVIIKRLDQHTKQLIIDKQIVPANTAIIREYARRQAIYKDHQKLAERHAQRAFEQTGEKAVETLRNRLAEMKADSTERGFEQQRTARSNSRNKARKLLAQISSGPPLSTRAFLRLYQPLVAGLWHSGGLQRGKNVVAKHAHAFQRALQSIGDIESLSVEKAFAVLHHKMHAVDGAGINVITEILHSLDNQRFVVMNQNSVFGLGLADVTGFPKNPNKRNVDSAIYADFCHRAGDVRDRLELNNFSELDALFDYAYWA